MLPVHATRPAGAGGGSAGDRRGATIAQRPAAGRPPGRKAGSSGAARDREASGDLEDRRHRQAGGGGWWPWADGPPAGSHPGGCSGPGGGRVGASVEALLFAVPLVLFVVLAATFIFVLHRAAQVMADTREIDAFRGRVSDLVARIDVSLTEGAEQIDRVRRHQVDPGEIRENIDAAADAVARYTEEGEALRPPPGLDGLRATLVDELARSGRALETVRHGCNALATGAAGPRQVEGQTSVKRGYLNILHARDALRRVAREAERARLPAPERRR